MNVYVSVGVGIGIAASYLVFVLLLTVRSVQNNVLYLHRLHWPWFANLTDPVRYGLPAGRSLSLPIHTLDGLQLGAWLVLPPSPAAHPFVAPPHSPDSAAIRSSLAAHPTVLLFHGNGGTRALSCRVQLASTFASRTRANVLAIDYRGFADSQGTPSEPGLVADARAAWDWAVAHGAQPHDIVLVGMSLGTGVSAALAAELAREDVHPRAVVLLAPFTSIDGLLSDYYLFRFIPVLQPLKSFANLQTFLLRFLYTHFNTSAALQHTKARVILIHARGDAEIPSSHSHALFEALLADRLPPPPAPAPRSVAELESYDWDARRAALEQRRAARDALVHAQPIEGFGHVHRAPRADGYGEVAFVDALWGGHDTVGLQATVFDILDSLVFE